MFVVASSLAWLIKPLLLHVILAVSLYIVLQPVTGSLIRSGLRESWAALLVLAGLIFLSAFSTAIIFPMLIEQFSQLQSEAPNILDSLTNVVEKIKSAIAEKTGITISTDAISGPILKTIDEWSQGAIFVELPEGRSR